jgi:hypothetical protein
MINAITRMMIISGIPMEPNMMELLEIGGERTPPAIIGTGRVAGQGIPPGKWARSRCP